jgi:F0F1-type ATP synthase gamma subunit
MPQFRKGQSGNPAGRPPGSRNRATSMVQNLLEGAAENIAKRAAQLAEDGNVAAIRICMNRLSPVGQHNPVAFELPPIHSTQDWSDKEEESESDVRLRVERMIAQGKAHPDDRFFYVSWRR